MTHPAHIPGVPPQAGGGPTSNGRPQPPQIQLPAIAVLAAPQGPEPALGPVPTSVSVDRVNASNGMTVIALRTATPQGVQIVFLMPDDAIRIGAFLRQHGKLAKSGVQLAPGTPLPADDADEDIGPELTEACTAELRLKGASGDWVSHGCVNTEPGHTAHAVDTVPAAHPLAGFRWGKEIEGDGYVATVPPES